MNNEEQEHQWQGMIENARMAGARNFRIGNVFHAPGRALFGERVHINGDLSIEGDIHIINSSLVNMIDSFTNSLIKINDKLDKIEERLLCLEMHIKYMPDGDGYIEAKNDFNNIKNNNNL